MTKRMKWMRSFHTRARRDTVAWPCLVIEELDEYRRRIVFLEADKARVLSTRIVKTSRLREPEKCDQNHEHYLRMEAMREPGRVLRKRATVINHITGDRFEVTEPDEPLPPTKE